MKAPPPPAGHPYQPHGEATYVAAAPMDVNAMKGASPEGYGRLTQYPMVYISPPGTRATADDALITDLEAVGGMMQTQTKVFRKLADLSEVASALTAQLDHLHRLQAGLKSERAPRSGPNMPLKEALKMFPASAPEPFTGIASPGLAPPLSSCEGARPPAAPTKLGGGGRAVSSQHMSQGDQAVERFFCKTGPEVYSLSDCSRMRTPMELGLEADRKLRAHFSKYGAGAGVFVARSRGPKAMKLNLPSSLGFVQMACPEVVRELVALGEEEIDGVRIEIQHFVPNMPPPAAHLPAQGRDPAHFVQRDVSSTSPSGCRALPASSDACEPCLPSGDGPFSLRVSL